MSTQKIRGSRIGYSIVWALTLLTGAGTLVFYPQRAAVALILALGFCFVPLSRAWRGARGTSLRPALVWASVALLLAMVAEWVASGESLGTGRPFSNQWIYLSALAALASLLSVLNARSPGSGAWALLMVVLVLVFLLPWLEGAGMVRQRDGWERLRLAVPWNYFLALLIFTAVSNYVMTRFGLAVAVAFVGFCLAWRGLTATGLDVRARGTLFAWVPWCWALAFWLADLLSYAWARQPATDFDRLWFWFRDHWGSVWALRTRDRFNATAEAAGWSFRLSWNGAASQSQSAIQHETWREAQSTLAALLRRFATRERVNDAIACVKSADLASPSPTRHH